MKSPRLTRADWTLIANGLRCAMRCEPGEFAEKYGRLYRIAVARSIEGKTPGGRDAKSRRRVTQRDK